MNATKWAQTGIFVVAVLIAFFDKGALGIVIIIWAAALRISDAIEART